MKESATTLIICDKTALIKEIIGTVPASANGNIYVGGLLDAKQINCPYEIKVGDKLDYYLLFHRDYRKDPLTQLFSREVINEAFSKLIKAQQSFVCVLADIDNLKLINDSQGHQVGDQALTALSTYFINNFREGDTLIRYGGDEFLLLLPIDAETIARQTITKRLTERFNNAPLAVSWGAAFYPADATTEHALIDCADKRLYQMKQSN